MQGIPNISNLKFEVDEFPLQYEVLPFEGRGDYTFDEFKQLEQRIVQHQRIIENLKINTWEYKHEFETVNIGKFKSVFLDSNDEFQQMKAMIDAFNSEVINAKQKNARIRNGIWRLAFFKSLASILREISFFTQSRELQAKFISKCYQWALETVTKVDFQSKKLDNESEPIKQFGKQNKRPQSSVKRPQSALTIKSMRPYSGATTNEQTQLDRPDSGITGITKTDNFMKESQLIKSTLPGDLIQEQLQDYKSGTRTKHDLLPPPEYRLTHYKRRIIQNFQAPRPQSAQQLNSKYSMVSAFPKPIKSAKPVIIAEEKDEEILEIQDNELNEEELAAKQAEEEAKLIIQEEEVKKKEKTLEPAIKVFLNDEQVENNQKEKQLNFENRDGFQEYQNTNQIDELQIQQRYQKQRNKEATQKREDEEMVAMMTQWSMNKAKMERELNRRAESAKIGNRYRELEMRERQNKEKDIKELDRIYRKHKQSLSRPKIGYAEELSDLSEDEQESILQNNIEIDGQTGLIDEETIIRQQRTRPKTAQQVNLQEKLPTFQHEMKFMNDTDYRGLEQQISKKNIKQIKKLHGNIIGLQEEDEANRLQPEQSMSIYGKSNNFIQQKRPFSAILASEPIDKVRYDQLQEIEEIKFRLAKKGVAIPVQKLVNALLIPDPINLQDPTGKNLPPPGFGIGMDPFAKKKKTKKKKKSKK